MDTRQHGRVRMRLSVRLRWAAPFGRKTEIANTMDVSRSGLLVSTREPHSTGITVWVTFPFDASLSDGQPEVPAQVVRCGEVLEVIRASNARDSLKSASASQQERSAKLDQLARAIGISDAPPTFAVALHFETRPHTSSNENTHHHDAERRKNIRKPLAIPVRVHPERMPWFEEAMTLDVSDTGMRFHSRREYASGERLKIAFEDGASSPWRGAREFLSEVVRVAPIAGSAALEISVHRIG